MSESGIDRHDEILDPDRRCLFIAEEETGVESESVTEYSDRTIVECNSTRDVVVKPVNAVKSRAKLCREHAEHLIETDGWEYVTRQKKLVTDGGTDPTDSEREKDMWEIGVRVAHDHDTWEHYHPIAETEEKAKEKALDEAKGIGSNSIAGIGDPVEVYMAAGPFERSDPARVSEEEIEEVFGR